VVDRIFDDVLEGGVVLLLGLDHLGPVAAPENVVLASVALVEGPGVGAVQVPHALVEVGRGRLHQEVVVVAHQAAHVHPPPVAPLHSPQDVDEDHPILQIEHDRRVVVPAAPNVVTGAREDDSVRPSHRSKVASREALVPRPRAFRHTSGAAASRARHETCRFWARPRLWSARGAGGTGSSPVPGAGCAGRACPCASWRGSAPRRRRARPTRSAPR
jgi:hypothetical protein